VRIHFLTLVVKNNETKNKHMISKNLLISDYPLDSSYVIFCDHFFPKLKMKNTISEIMRYKVSTEIIFPISKEVYYKDCITSDGMYFVNN